MLAFTVVKWYHIKQIKFLTNQEDLKYVCI